MEVNYQRNVEEFMRLSGQVVYEKPRVMTLDQAALRYDLYREEVEELVEAYKERNRVLALDAVIDTLYILLGTAATAGHDMNRMLGIEVGALDKHYGEPLTIIGRRLLIRERLDTLLSLPVENFRAARALVMEVARLLGFTKKTIQTAFQRVHASNMTKFCPDSATVNATVKAYAEKGVNTYVECVGDYLVVYRHPDGKVMKSVDYEPVVLEDLVEGVTEWE